MRTTEVARRTGVSYRRLDYWARRGWIRPRYSGNGSGIPRDWSEADVERALEIRDAYAAAAGILRRARIPVPSVFAGRTKRRRAA